MDDLKDVNWKTMLAFGIAVALICVGIGGCEYLMSKGEQLRSTHEVQTK